MRLARPGGDALAGLALAGLGGFITLRAASWDLMGPDGPGPGFFPFGYGVLMLGLSVALVVQATLRAPRAHVSDLHGHFRALLTWAVFAGTAMVMQWVGFALGFAALTAFIVIYVFERSWRVAALVAIACAVGFWGLFTQILGVALPVGPWGF